MRGSLRSTYGEIDVATPPRPAGDRANRSVVLRLGGLCVRFCLPPDRYATESPACTAVKLYF